MRTVTSIIRLTFCLLLAGCSAIRPGPDKDQAVQNITPFGANSSGPFWAASSGELIASHLVYPKYDSQIYKFDVHGRQKELLLETTGRVDVQAISADGNDLLFASFGSDDFEAGIWTMDLTQKKASFVGPGDAAGWSPDEHQLAVFNCQDRSKVQIKTYDVRSSEEITLLEQGGPCYGPNARLAWSPDGKKLAFSYARVAAPAKPDTHIYLYNFVTGSVESNLGNLNSITNWSPSWSPDSRYLAYTIPSSYKLAVYDAQKKCTKAIDLSSVPIVGSVAWSPDGTMWAISGSDEMYIIEIDGLLGRNYLTTSICD